MTYDYVAWKEENIWTAYCPAVPGAYGLGDTPVKAVKDLKEALSELASYLGGLGESLPRGGQIRTGELSL